MQKKTNSAQRKKKDQYIYLMNIKNRRIILQMYGYIDNVFNTLYRWNNEAIQQIFQNIYMEKTKNSTLPSQHLISSISSQSHNLFSLLPKQLTMKYKDQKLDHPQDCLYQCITQLHSHNKTQQLIPFFQQIGADMSTWEHKSTSEQKTQYILEMLYKNSQEGLKRINGQSSSYINLVTMNRKVQRNIKQTLEKQKQDQFDWLVLNTKNEMLKSKLKTKLVQTINQYKNEKKLREVMGRQLEDNEKIHLEDESIQLYQDDKSKIHYDWTKQDEQMFLTNIRKLKQKFTQTEFLKNCHRYKFITYSQLKTLAAEQISRKLDKNNKAFLSRQFLLDKYFSTKDTLTQKQMKFILKTSPLLSKCVDKAFVRSAIKNIQYQDIDKMELQIAEEIIQKFQMIRNLVKNSRKMYKQKLNNKVKKRIQVFQREKQYSCVRASMNDKLNLHKTKMLRNMNYRPSSTKSSKYEPKRTYDLINGQQTKSHQKMTWPVPLNNKHPSTGLFIRDCSEQLNDDFNDYEKNYLKKMLNSEDLTPLKKSVQTKASMINFYTGGPIDIGYQSYKYDSSSSSSLLKKSRVCTKNEKLDNNVTKIVCQAFKINQYIKQLQEKLNSIQLIDQCDEEGEFIDKRMFCINKHSLDLFVNDLTKKTKRSADDDESINHSIMNTANKMSNSTEKAIKDKIVQGKQKAKMTVYVKKLLSLAAENAFLSLKALNAKFTPSQVNSYDAKGNTALFYATKNKNVDFIDYLLGMKADVNMKCAKGATPLHNAFRSSNYSIICKCLSGAQQPNLNALDDDGKTPLAYCCRKILQMLNLQQGVVCVYPGEKIKFNNNSLLTANSDIKSNEDELEAKLGFRRKASAKQIR